MDWLLFGFHEGRYPWENPHVFFVPTEQPTASVVLPILGAVPDGMTPGQNGWAGGRRRFWCFLVLVFWFSKKQVLQWFLRLYKFDYSWFSMY